MPHWTKEQQQAIDESGQNIIVSAGAGSGKTAVLTERVIQKLKHGEDVSKLLILTFTNAAAKEMKDRIRKAIKENELFDQLDKIDSSYITTFDSFSLSVVKKYHYLLNINQDVEIADSLILKWEKEKILDNIFQKLYTKKAPLFLKLIKDFTTRDDQKIKDYILNMDSKINLKYAKDTYLNTYLDTFYQDDYLKEKIKEYENILLKKIEKIKENLSQLELIVDGDFYHDFYLVLEPLVNSLTYDTIKNNLDFSLPRLKKGMDDVKPLKENITKLISDLKKLTIYDSREEIFNSLKNTYDYVQVIIQIIQELDQEFLDFKKQNNLYDFLDISKMAISIVKDNKEVLLELKNSFHEILVDEYQDTSDLQELFISLISNNNVYMVGDIKQSIYRFRNANPNLFKEKYVNYSNHLGGLKIDLVKNFRSREETLNNINYIFNSIMDLEMGGADYSNSHQMVFGNTLYTENKKDNQDYNFEIYNYELTDKTYSKDEVEAFITGYDILDKVNNNYQVFDKNKKVLRNITYDDFVILIDKSTSFDLYKKIFEYLNIPLTILKDENISGNNDLYILKNIFLLLDNYKKKKIDNSFKYAYLSIGRSYLFNLSDDYLYQTIKNNNYDLDPIIEKIKKLTLDIDFIPVSLLIERIIQEFSIYEKLITVGNINESIIRLDYLKDLSSNLSNLGYTYEDYLNYLTKMIENNDEIKYSLNKEISNSVKIMTIHKSKGLEFPICYYTGLNNKFNTSDLKQRFIYDNKLGFITPTIKDNGLLNTIYHTLYKEDYLKEDISERIRLFYVALTRAKEKMILITTFKEEDVSEEEIVSLDIRLKYNSLASILNSLQDKLINYLKPIDLNNYKLTKDYMLFNTSNINKSSNIKDKLEVEELKINYSLVTKDKFFKTNHQLLTKEDKEKFEFGSYLHYLLEITDFKKKDLTLIDEKYQPYFLKLFNLDLFNNLDNTNIYKEYEFIYESNNIKKHGIIDLMIEHDNYIDIIDYKLKNIEDNLYQEQLLGYKEYIKTKTNKDINLYLYSIIDGRYEKIE